jgi:hypothetical protein
MKSFAHSCLLFLALAAVWSHADTLPDPSLMGCWRAVKIVLYTHDGSRMEDASGRCTLRFHEDRLDSTCATAGGAATTTYRYQVVRPNVYLTTMQGSTFRTDLIGSTREYEYRLEGDRLFTATSPPASSPASPTATKRVESEAERTSCP